MPSAWFNINFPTNRTFVSFSFFCNYTYFIEAAAYKEAAANGMKIVKLTSSELEALKKASSSVIDDYIKRTGGAGGVGDKLVKAAKKL